VNTLGHLQIGNSAKAKCAVLDWYCSLNAGFQIASRLTTSPTTFYESDVVAVFVAIQTLTPRRS